MDRLPVWAAVLNLAWHAMAGPVNNKKKSNKELLQNQIYMVTSIHELMVLNCILSVKYTDLNLNLYLDAKVKDHV